MLGFLRLGQTVKKLFREVLSSRPVRTRHRNGGSASQLRKRLATPCAATGRDGVFVRHCAARRRSDPLDALLRSSHVTRSDVFLDKMRPADAIGASRGDEPKSSVVVGYRYYSKQGGTPS